MEISVVLPAYCEAENLITLLPCVKRALDTLDTDYEVIVVDACETKDQTKMICEKCGVIYCNRTPSDNYGDAIRTGFNCATGKYIVVMDADGSHSPKYIPKFYERMINEKADIVIGSRYISGGHTDNSWILVFMSYVLNLSYRFLFHLKVHDVSDSYRMYDAKALSKIKLESDNFDIVEELLIKINRNGGRIVEEPISFDKRKEGESKRDLKKFIKSYIKTMVRLKRL